MTLSDLRSGIDWLEILESPKFGFFVASIVEICSEPGSYEREVCREAAKAFKRDIEQAAMQWRVERNISKNTEKK